MTALAGEAKKVRGAGQAGEQIKEVCFTRPQDLQVLKSHYCASIHIN
jgi:hypothetical protein